MNRDSLSTAVLAAIVVAIGLVALGAVPIYAGGLLLYQRIAYGSAASSATADVVSADRLWVREKLRWLTSPGRAQPIWEVTYEFKTAKGAVVRSTGIHVRSRTLTKVEPGTKLRVLFLPEDPASSYINDLDKPFDGVWYLGLGLFIWLVAGLFVYSEIKRRRGPVG